MENSNLDLYHRYNQERLIEKTASQVDMLRVMDNFKKSVDFFNSFGIKNTQTTKKPLG